MSRVQEGPAAPAPESPEPELASQESWTHQWRGLALRLLALAASLLTTAGFGVLAILIVRQSWADVIEVADAIWSYPLFDRDSLASILDGATPLIFAGLAAAIALKAGLFNIGVEGQYAIGALCAGYVGYRLSAPTAVHLPLAILAGMAGGLLWAAVPALLKAYRGVHEVISTIMMSFVADAVLVSLLPGALEDPSQRGPTRDPASPTWLFALAIVAAAAYALTMRRTRFGFELRVLGANPRAAEPSGIRGKATIVKVMLMSGAIAGLAGLQDVLAVDDRGTLDDIRGYGFIAIAIALLGRNSGLGIVAAALLFSLLDQASSGIALHTEVPGEVTDVLQGAIILTSVIAFELVRRMTARRQLREQHDRA
jgi:general nucleoside transport system permease protein